MNKNKNQKNHSSKNLNQPNSNNSKLKKNSKKHHNSRVKTNDLNSNQKDHIHTSRCGLVITRIILVCLLLGLIGSGIVGIKAIIQLREYQKNQLTTH